MKKLILILGAAASLLVAGCNQGGTDQGQGGTSDQNNRNTGAGNSQNAHTNSNAHP